MTQNRKGSKDFWQKCLKQLIFLYGPRNFAPVSLMHDYVMKEKFLAFALAVLGYSIQLYCLGIFLCKISPLYNGPFPSSPGPLFQKGVGTRR